MYMSASAPEAPPLSDTTIGCFIRLFFWIAACIIRAIWSDAPPAPAATTISTGLVGSQAALTGAAAMRAANAAADLMMCPTRVIPIYLLYLLKLACFQRIVRSKRTGFNQLAATGRYDFRMRRDATCQRKAGSQGSLLHSPRGGCPHT